MKTLKIIVGGLVLFLAFAIVRPVLLAQGATQLTYGQPLDATFAASQNTMQYTFAGKTGDKVTVIANALSGGVDPFVDLYDPQGKLIGEDDNSGGKDNALLNGIVLSADGAYKLAVMNKRAGGSGKYSLLIREEKAQSAVYFDGPPNKEAYQLSQPWNHRNITYRIENTEQGFNAQDVRNTIAQAFQSWANVTPLTFQEVTSGQSDLDITFAPIDGPMNVLGETCPPSSPCSGQIQFDSQEPWVMGAASGFGVQQISFLAVASHEFGHAIGLLHSSDTGALMYPEYNPNILQPEADDVRGAQALYGAGTGGVNSPTSPPSSNPQVTGTLTDMKWANFWDFDVNAGESVTITMKGTSGGLDSFLVLLDANNHILAYDDDNAGGRDAVLRNIKLPQSGTYTIAATRYQQAQGYTSGDYTLTIDYGQTNAPAPAPTTVNQPPQGSGTVTVSAGQATSLQQNPSLDSVIDAAFSDSPTPDVQTRNATVQRSQAYSWDATWCAKDAATLNKNLPNITVKFAVSETPVDAKLVTQSQPHNINGLSCVDYYVVLSDWAAGTVSLTKTLTLKDATFDGTTIYAPGDYVYKYSVTVQ